MKTTILFFILGILVSCEKVVQKSDFEVSRSSIDASLPILCKNPSSYSKCWGQFSKEEMSYSVASQYAETSYAHYKNLGYDVVLKENSLVFNFKNEHQKYLEYQEKWISIEGVIFSIPFVFLILMYGMVSRNYRKRVDRIRKIYATNPKDIVFWGDNQKIFEEALKKNQIPSHWFFNIDEKNGKIVSIMFHNGRMVESIATCKSSLVKSFKSAGF